MTSPAHTNAQAAERPDAHRPSPGEHEERRDGPHAAAGTTVAVLMVTWNRHATARRAIESVLAQRGVDAAGIHLVVVDNASTDGTTEQLARWLDPERIVANSAQEATEPRFAIDRDGGPNRVGLASVTLVRNACNLGGTGGFNTAFLAARAYLADPCAPEFLWLLDDDAVADPHALGSLLATAQAHPDAGLVGARAVDITDRRTTYETTIYYDPVQGRMADTPHRGHRLGKAHAQWIERVGATRGQGPYAGVVEVDVASACCLLARWSILERVGYWDARYFIYCDDADWCLRTARAGHRVLCDLDAVVYHTPWFQKLTPSRLYYAQRNAIWTMRKGLPAPARRRATARWMVTLLRDSLAAACKRRRVHAEIIRRTAHDAATNRAGRLDLAEPPAEPIDQALHRLRLDRPDARVAILCNAPDHAPLAEAVAEHLRRGLGPRCPALLAVVRHDVAAPRGVPTLAYAPDRASRLRATAALVRRRVNACVVLNNTNDLPVRRCPISLHVDHRNPTLAQAEADTLAGLAAFAVRWLSTACIAAYYCLLPERAGPRAPFG
ncbi:MAG: hypothetical protein KatS3mg103_0869 [Phycisphaerales bacterium]|nr:MAG: hypothetical protein KatS3mg103_0869 [Phycisphaerales bacterium]